MPPPLSIVRVTIPAAMLWASLSFAAADGSKTLVHDTCANCHNAAAAAATAGAAAITLDPVTGMRSVRGMESFPPAAGSSTPATVPCRSCHAGLHPAGAVAVNAHDRLACVTCHDPHRNGVPFRFRRTLVEAGSASAGFDAETRLCLACHVEQGQFRGTGGFVRHPVGVPAARHDDHVVAVATGFDLGRVATGEVTLPLVRLEAGAAGRDVVGCGTCHSLHGSGNGSLLRWKAGAEEIAACGSCHQDALESGQGATRAPSAASMDAWLRANPAR